MSRVGILSAVTAAVALVLGAGSTSAQVTQAGGCRLVIETAADEWLLRYDPFDQDAAQQTFDLAVVNQGDAPCAARSRVDLRGEAFGLARVEGGGRLDYALVEERAGVEVTPRAGVSARRMGGRMLNLAPGERGLLRFSLATGVNEVIAAGRYTQHAVVNLETEDGRSLAERPVALTVEIPRVAVMGLKGEFQRSGGMATIDLGELKEGARPLRTTLYVLSTSGYAVSVTSQNNGRLRQGNSGWYISYGLSLGGQSVDLGGGGRLEVASRGPRFDDYPLALTIGETAGKRAGEYRDILTFTVAAI